MGVWNPGCLEPPGVWNRFIGRISRGFDFLSYAFTPAGLEASPPTIERSVERVSQVDERAADLTHIGTYVRRWLQTARSGLGAMGAARAGRALGLLVRSLVRVRGALRCPLATTVPASANCVDGEDCTQRRAQHDQP
jgi:hypothetical protein